MPNLISPDDRVRIMELISDYAFNLDGGHLEEYVASFAPAGALTNRTGSFDGREAIRDYVGHLTEIGQVGPTSHIHHFIGLPLIRGDSEAAHASAYVAISGSSPSGEIQTYLEGIYELDFVKVDGDWRFKTRHSRMDLTGPERQIAEPSAHRSYPAKARMVDSMSAEDKLDVIDMLAGYAFLLDSGDVEGYVANFTPEGVFEGAGGPMRGRAAIGGYVRQVVDRSAAGQVKMRHVMGIPSIRGNGERCESETYVLILRQENAGKIFIRSIGQYSDEIVKVDGRWLFARRRATMHQTAVSPT